MSPSPIGIWTGTALALIRSFIICTAPAKSAPVRSILLTKAMRGTPYLFICRHTVSLCGSTPPTAQKSATAPSRMRKRTFHLNGEVDVARRVDDVDAMVLPEAGCRSTRDRDATLFFLLHPVHRRAALVDLAHAVQTSGIEKDALGGGRFPRRQCEPRCQYCGFSRAGCFCRW